MAQAQVAGQSGSSSRSGGGGSGGGGSGGGGFGGGGSGGGGAGAGVGPTLAGATDAIVGAARDALTGIDAILSYRPGDLSAPKPAPTSDPVSDPTQDSTQNSTQDSASADGAADSDGQPVVDSQPCSAAKRENTSMSLTIGVDVGGTKIAAGVVDAKGSIVEMVKRPTPAANASGTIDVISDAVCELLARYEVDVVGIGAAASSRRAGQRSCSRRT